MLEYENYHCHAMYSNCLTQPDSTVSIEDYAKVYRERGQHVLCISEHGNRSNVWQQAEIAEKYSDDTFTMRPLAAAECYFVPYRDPARKDDRNFHLILVAKDNVGLRQLNRILSEANLNGFYRKARVDYELLASLDPTHFICTTACVAGPVRDNDALKMCLQLRGIFRENFFLEVQHHHQKIQVEHNEKILSLYKQTKIPLIYGTDSHYINHSDSMLRKELLLSSGIRNAYEDDFDLYLPTAREAYDMMLAQGVLSRAQIEEAMENTLILRSFEGVSFTTEKKIPNSRPAMTIAERNHLYKKEVCDGYMEKAGMPSKEEAKELHAEMDAVADTGTADYFITMKDIVDKGVEYGGVLTTTGRGSGVSFATNYALGFTSLNRLKSPVRLYPERFISKERLESGALPDLDLNMSNVPAFEKAGKEILGDWGCLPMIAFGTCKTLSAFKLLARARDLDFETSNIISKQIQNYEMDAKHARENNQDNPDYDVNDDVHVEDYVDEQYLQLLEESKKYRGIVTTIVPHPCAHLLLDRDIREEIGVIRVKAKSGSKEPVYAAYIDGTTADKYGYLKADYLRVDVVKSIAETFEACGLPVMPVDELLEKVKDDTRVWELYANGFTMGLNQCEKAKTSERAMRYKPKNIVELAAFVAAVRPGFKSMLETFVSRTSFSYGIPALDKLLSTKEIPSSFLLYDEQILHILQAAGITPADAYACVKAIKKKKADKVMSYKTRFCEGFKHKLMTEDGSSESDANATVNQIWTIIENAANYMFCAAHALSMACDSLYSAWLKVHYPYEFYTTLLKLYTKKGNKEKVAQIANEMARYIGVHVRIGMWGEDNRDWYIDREHKYISQSLSSVKFISSNVANDLLKLYKEGVDSFSNLLYLMFSKTKINSRQIDVLISLGYFKPFGGAKKLRAIAERFREGENKISKALIASTVEKRLSKLNEFEKETADEDDDIENRLASECEYMGQCFSSDKDSPTNEYFVEEVDDVYGVKVALYSVKRGARGIMRIKKDVWSKHPLEVGQFILLNKYDKRGKFGFKNGERVVLDNEFDLWLSDYNVCERKEE